MPLPEGFSEFEHLQDLIRLEHNKVVRAYFKNQADNDISTPKAGLKHACLIKDDDSAAMTQMRQWLF
jgi:predicted dinucleotide-binding enzyme